ncbi:DNA adenine methylase [Flagellimonas sp. 389]|uniref:DNA adenine methylase n=1 Tax=Flagellimonas sp. 389 TaxID=2835862 RepID=UPI001BD3EAC7|nr:DNA adenine methylase [Flagellimonas sp. 389]MBS9463803.1 DNA adenine methylase [Flagellimonas sp. 389]
MSNFYSPLRYPGGKNCIFKFVSNFFYENELLGCSYAEPYAGGSGLALRLLFEGYVESIYINDLDKFIYSFWKSVLQNNDEICNWIESVPLNIETWHIYKKIQLNPENHHYLDLAKATFYLNRTNVSGVIKGGVIGGQAQLGKYKINARFNKSDLIKRIRKIFQLKNRIHLSNLDGLQFIKKMNNTKQNIFIYLDPPYYQKGSDLYMNFYKEADHKKLSNAVKKINHKWMVSYDNNDFIVSLYSEFEKILYQLAQSTSNRTGDEILVFSKGLDYQNAMLKLKEPIKI